MQTNITCFVCVSCFVPKMSGMVELVSFSSAEVQDIYLFILFFFWGGGAADFLFLLAFIWTMKQLCKAFSTDVPKCCFIGHLSNDVIEFKLTFLKRISRFQKQIFSSKKITTASFSSSPLQI